MINFYEKDTKKFKRKLTGSEKCHRGTAFWFGQRWGGGNN